MGKVTKKEVVFYLIHFIGYQSAWITSIFMAAKNYIWSPFFVTIAITSVQLCFHRYQRPFNKDLGPFVILFLISGGLGDSVIGLFNFMAFKNSFGILPPPFMFGLWLNFAVTFHCTIIHIRKRYAFLAILAVIGFPLAYGLGAKLEAATLTQHGLIGVSAIWGFLFPFTMFIFNRIRK